MHDASSSVTDDDKQTDRR